jgi:hypothetical protein
LVSRNKGHIKAEGVREQRPEEDIWLRGRERQGNGENYIIRSFLIYTPQQILFDEQNPER